MPYCSQCGVEVDENVLSCPLCQTPIQQIGEGELPRGPYPEKAAGSPPIPPLTFNEKMGIARTITTIGFLIPLLFISAIDYFLTKSISWSAIVDVSLVGVWAITIICLFSWKSPYLLAFFIHLDMVVFLFVLTRVIHGSYWMVGVGIPITVGSHFITWGTLYIIRRIRGKGASIAGIILLAISLLCGVIDLTLGLQEGEILQLGWSLIVFSVLVPTAGLLFYVQSARFSHSNLRRFFHF